MAAEPFPFNLGGGPTSNSTAQGKVKEVFVHVIHAGFGDATLLEVTHDDGKTNHFLVDGGPTKVGYPVYYYRNLFETLLALTCKDEANAFKLDGIMVTHPDGDHIQGVIRLFEEFPPNVSFPSKAMFHFKGPLLLTKAFWATGKRSIESRKFISTTLTEAKFLGEEATNREHIKGFETLFQFYYPDDNATGLVFNYTDNPPKPFKYPKLATPFEPNKTSILMLVDDPANQSQPMISLNGDGYGGDILQLVKDKPLKVFKVPHHGSRDNSLPLNVYRPDEQLYTRRLLATEALIDTEFAYTLAGSQAIKKFEEVFKPVPGGYRRQLLFVNILNVLATTFQKLIEKRHDPQMLLNILKQRREQIEANLNDANVEPKDLYTNGMASLDPNFSEDDYTSIKKEILKAQRKADKAVRKDIIANIKKEMSDQPVGEPLLPYKRCEAFGRIFKCLETDSIYLDQVCERFTTKFYKHINAITYIISAGDRHTHPHWQVVNGIIKAAIARRSSDPTYMCRLLLTSGNGINEAKLPDQPCPNQRAGFAWKGFVSLQYFIATESVSVRIDPNEKPETVIPGTKQWDHGKITPTLKEELKNTKAAGRLKRNRERLDDERYFVMAVTQSSPPFYLNITQDRKLVLSTTKEQFLVYQNSKITRNARKADTYLLTMVKADTQTPLETSVNGCAQYSVPGHTVAYTLFVDDHGHKEYLRVEDGKLTYNKKKEKNATPFQFIPVPISTLTSRFYRSIPPKTSTSAPLIGTKITASIPTEVTVMEYLRRVGFSISSGEPDCRTLLTLVLGQPTAPATAQHMQVPLHSFLEQMLSWKVDISSTFQLPDSQVKAGSIKIVLPPTPPTLEDSMVLSITVDITAIETLSNAVSISVCIAVSSSIPSTLTYKSLQWRKCAKDGKATLEIAKPEATDGTTFPPTFLALTSVPACHHHHHHHHHNRGKYLHLPYRQHYLSYQDYLTFVHFNGDASDIDASTLLKLILSDQVASQLTTSTNVSHDSPIYHFIQEMLTWRVLDSSTFQVSENETISARVHLQLPSPPPSLDNKVMLGVSLEVISPKTPNLKLWMELDEKGFCIPVTHTYHLENLIEYFVQGFNEFLQAIEIIPPRDGFNFFDATILLFQSEAAGYICLMSFPKALVSTILHWKVDLQQTNIAFAYTPTRVILTGQGGKLVPIIPNTSNSFDIGLDNLVHLTSLALYIPPQMQPILSAHITAEAIVGSQKLQITASAAQSDALPLMEFTLTGSLSLSDILSFLQLDSAIGTFQIPMLSSALNVIQITEAGFTIGQAVQNSNSTNLHSVRFGVEFANLSSYIPSVFSSLKEIDAHAVVYFSSNSARKVGFQVDFVFEVQEQEKPPLELSASLSTQPVKGKTTTEPDYTFHVSIQTATAEGITLNGIMTAFGLRDALSSVNAFPILKSLLTNVQLQALTLLFNTANTAIRSFTLHLLVLNWEIVPGKLRITLFDMYMCYMQQKWNANFEANAVFAEMYPVTVTFQLPDTSQPGILQFTNSNHDFSVATFLDIFGLGDISEIPIIGNLLQTSITEVYLSLMKPSNSSAISVSSGRVAMYVERISLGSLLKLFQIDIQINYSLDDDTKGYAFGFLLSGFVNNKIYLNVGYDRESSVLSGQAIVASFMEADLAFASQTFLGSNSLKSNDVYKLVSNKPTAEMSVKLKLGDQSSVTIQQLVIQLHDVLSVGSLQLESLKFDYLYDVQSTRDEEGGSERIEEESSDPFPPGTRIKLTGLLSSNENKFSALLEFNLNKDTTGETALTASIRPNTKHSLKLRSFLSLLGVGTPDIPQVEGQENPNFLDLEITSGSVSFSISPFEIIAFDVKVQTTQPIQLLVSPRVVLDNLTCRVTYAKDHSTPMLKASLLGALSLPGIKLWLEGVKETNGLVFTATAIPPQKTTDFQKVIGQFTPSESTPPTIPADINLPSTVGVSVSKLVIKLLKDQRSFYFLGATRCLNWKIQLGFQDFSVKDLGGLLDYEKMLTGDTTTAFTVYLIGQFQYSNSTAVSMDSELHFGSNADTVLAVRVLEHDVSKVQIPALADNVLGFNHPKPQSTQLTSSSVSFDSLLPTSTHNIELLSASINLNLTKSQFLLAGRLVSLGTGLFLAGKFTGKQHYGYAFGVSLPNGFRFSQLLADLSVIDNIFHVRKANAVIFFLEGVKVTDVVESMKDAEEALILQNEDSGLSLPFTNLKLDSATSNKLVGKGMSFYAEIDFGGAGENSVFYSIIQIGDHSTPLPDVVVSANISSQPKDTRFEAHIERLVLLGQLEFKNVMLVYEPNNHNSLNLDGTVIIHLGPTSHSFCGTLHSTSTQAAFSVTSDPTKHPTIVEPFGMFGISLRNAMLSLVYQFPKDKPITSHYQISGTVDFYSSVPVYHSTLTTEGYGFPPPSPTISLTGQVIFTNFHPQVMCVILEANRPLTISDFVATVFHWHYGTDFLNLGLVNGQLYYASLPPDKSVKINDVIYVSGYHISADVEIYSKRFKVEADIPNDKSSLTITGSAYGAIDLGFAKFTGINKEDRSQPDESRSPQLTFMTSSSETSISIGIGLILFQTPLATAPLGYKPAKRAFLGQLTYSGDIGFIHHPSISFQWSRDEGFQITNWPMSGKFPFDLFEKLRKYQDRCGDLVDLVFDKGLETKFNVNTEFATTRDPNRFLADINIYGTYNILLAGEVKIADIELPPLAVGIPKVDDFTLFKLPGFIMKCFTENASDIVQQLVSNPTQLAKVLSIIALKSLTKKAVETLACRKVDDSYFRSEVEDITSNDFKTVNEEEGNADKLSEESAEALEKGELEAAAAAAAGMAEIASDAIALLSGIIDALGSILSIFDRSSYSEKKKKAEKDKKKFEKMEKETRQKIEDALDIEAAPNATFTPPNKLSIMWNGVHYSGLQYHVQVKGNLIKSASGQSTKKETIYDEIVPTVSVEFQNERLYHAVGLTVSVWGTITATKHKHTATFNGRKYQTEVQNVHPTLLPPLQVTAAFNHKSLQIVASAAKVEYAHCYFLQLGETEGSFDEIAECSVTPSKGTTIKCSFSHSEILDDTSDLLSVRCQAVAETSSGIASSVFTYSNSLHLAPPITDFVLTLPHFSNASKTLMFAWTLPSTTTNINAILCQIVHKKSKTVLVQQHLNPTQTEYGVTVFPTSCNFALEDIVHQLVQHDLIGPPTPSTHLSQPNTLPTTAELASKVSTIGSTDQTIDSVFVTQTFNSLKPPNTVSFNFSMEKNILRVSWAFTQDTNYYGILILGSNHSVVWSKQIHIPSDDDEHEEKVGYSISDSELSAVNDPSIEYRVQVTAVTSGNSELDSLLPTEAQRKLQVCSPPRGKSLEFSPSDNNVTVTFMSVSSVTLYSVEVIKAVEGLVLAQKNVALPAKSTPTELHGSVDLDTFIARLGFGDVVKASVQCLGGGTFLPSAIAEIPNASLVVLQKPSKPEYSYSPQTNTISLTSATVEGVTNYLLGFFDPSGQAKDVAQPTQASDANATADISADLLRNSEVGVWKAFARSVGDSTHLSSKCTVGNSVQVLSKPVIQSLQYSAPSFNCTWDPVTNVSYYEAVLRVLAVDDSELYKLTKSVEPSGPSSVMVSIDAATEIPKRPSLLKELQSVTITVTAVGSGFFLSSPAGDPHSLFRFSAPKQLQYSYSPDTDAITISCQKVDGVARYTLGFSNPESPDENVTKTLPGGEEGTLSATFKGQELRHSGLHNWKVFAQSLGNTTHFSSEIATLENTATVLSKPSIMSVQYDALSNNFSATWASETNVSHYTLKISVKGRDGTVLRQLDKTILPTTTSTVKQTVDMGTDIHGWNTLLTQVSAISGEVSPIGSGYCITGETSDPSVANFLNTPATVTIVSDGSITVSWTAVTDAAGYTVDMIVNGESLFSMKTTVTSFTLSQSALALLSGRAVPRTSSPTSCVVEANVTAYSSSSSAPGEGQKQITIPEVKKSPLYGGRYGDHFDDDFIFGGNYMGIKAIRLYYGDQVNSIQTTYIEVDGSTRESDHHGEREGKAEYIELEAGEEIVEVNGCTDHCVIQQITFITQKADGTSQTYGPFGKYTPQSNEYRLRGKILGFYGLCGTELKAIGFYYIQS